MKKEFLDPATIPSGTFVTITGEVVGSVALPLNETEYTYPIVGIKNVRLLPKDEEGSPCIQPYISPDRAPYWSPYWRPRPYW